MSKGVMRGSRDPVFEFWEPPNISRTVEARNFKFGKDTDGSEFSRGNCKIRSKGVMWGSRDLVLEFWDPPNKGDPSRQWEQPIFGGPHPENY